MLVILTVGCMVALASGKELTSNLLPPRGKQIWKLSEVPRDVMQTLEFDGLVDILDHSTGHTISVAPEHMNAVNRILEDNKVDVEVAVQDLSKYFEEREAEEKAEQHRNRILGCRVQECTALNCTSPLTDDYMSFAQMEYYLKHINKTFSDRVTLTSIGKSHENRDIWMVHIKSGGCNPTKKRRMAKCASKPKAIWLEGGIHAREWISPSVALQMIDRFVTECENTRFYDVYAVPMSNPDGYVYTHVNVTSRDWRKNRAHNAGSKHRGVDLNRNWGYKWGGVRASPHTWSETYRGESAFSEPETKALSNAMKEIKDLELYLAFHSFGQLLLFPWGWTEDLMVPVPDKEAMERMADVFVEKAKYRHGTHYNPISASRLYAAAGTSMDWAKGGLGVKYTYTLELRSLRTSPYGFELPKNQILPTGQEVWDGLKNMLAAMRQN